MPIYEYKCRKCGREFEVFQKITEAPVQQCQFCQGQVEKMISLSSFQLTGSGWYVTDYGGKKSCALDSRQKEATVSSSDAAPSCGGGESSCCAGCKAAE